jgi:hypothetical protein
VRLYRSPARAPLSPRVAGYDLRSGSNPTTGLRSGLGTGPSSGGGTRVPGGTSVFALLDVNDRTTSDSLDRIDKTHLLVLGLAAGTVRRLDTCPTRACRRRFLAGASSWKRSNLS